MTSYWAKVIPCFGWSNSLMNRDATIRTDRVPHGRGGDPGVLDCTSGANPKRPSGVARVYQSALSSARTYPNDDYCEFRIAAGEFAGCDPQHVVPTGGGMAALRLAVGATVGPGDDVAVPYPSFPEYRREIRVQGGTPRFVRWAAITDVDPGEYALVVAPNPNDPTGTAYADEALRDLAHRCRAAGTPLLVDEAHLGFTNRISMAGVPGTVVVRAPMATFGFPGIRAGFAVATGELLTALENGRPAWSLGVPGMAVATHCMADTEFLAETRQWASAERERVGAALSAEFGVHPSDSQLLVVDVGDRDPAAVVRRARDEGVAIRDVSNCRGLDSHVGVALKKPEANDRLVETLLDV